jgi:quinol monooxygenase YgiN
MILVLAIVMTKPGKREEVLANVRTNLPRMHAEPGCIEYALSVDAEVDTRHSAASAPGLQIKLGPDTFAGVEKWENLDTLNAHIAALPSAPSSVKNRDLIASRIVHDL